MGYTGVDYSAEEDIARLFEVHRVASTPRVVLRERSAMSVMVSLRR